MYSDDQLDQMNARLIELYPVADDPDDMDYDQQLVKHYSQLVLDETE